VAAFLVVGDDTFDATAAALAFYGLAGAKAAKTSRGPGSFAVAFLDALAAVTPQELDAAGAISNL
jgi:hydroxyethylthiazole kinase